jgi:tetratricopeptide (TPR) repeat protein
MNRSPWLTTALFIALAGIALPAAAAQCMGNLTPPHVLRMGTHSAPAAGNGTVRVQVQLNANGTHTVTRILSSTNHGDDAAAREVAQSSTYIPAKCDGKPITWFYDPIFRITGAGVSSGGGSTAGASEVQRIEGLVRTGRYDDAKTAAQQALQSKPNDPDLLRLLGVAEYYSHDYGDAANAFERAGNPGHLYATVAAQSYASAAVQLSNTDPAKALDYAQHALALDHGANSRFALGVAQLGNKDYAAAIATLSAVRRQLAGDPHADAHQRYVVDSQLLTAYIGAGEADQTQSVAAEMHQLEPNNTSPYESIGAVYLNQCQAAMTAKNYAQAIPLCDKAAALPDPHIQLIAYVDEGYAEANMTKPDPVQLKAYADKALAIDANDPRANFLEGFALMLQYQTSHHASDRQQALVYLNKADAEAKAAGNTTLAQNVEHIISQLNAAGGGMP